MPCILMRSSICAGLSGCSAVFKRSVRVDKAFSAAAYLQLRKETQALAASDDAGQQKPSHAACQAGEVAQELQQHFEDIKARGDR